MRSQQPYLHDLVALVQAPAQAWCSVTGDIAPGSVGIVVGDVQVVAALALTLDGEPVTWIHRHVAGTVATFIGVARHLQDEAVSGPDPQVSVVRTRRLTHDGVEERVEVRSALDTPLSTVVHVALTPALDPIDQVKEGHHQPVQVTLEGDRMQWSNASVVARLSVDGRSDPADLGEDVVRLWHRVEVPARGAAAFGWRLDVELTESAPVVAASTVAAFGGGGRDRAASAEPEDGLRPPAGSRTRRWWDRSLADLAGLRLEHRSAPGHAFYGAGAPWYLTLFGRDSLWAARLAREVGPDVARSTLRVLAGLQGRAHDPQTEEAPGKILHEIRTAEFSTLPARYYGTVDATPLWVNLLADLDDGGVLARPELERLRPALVAALGWVTGPYADPDGDGLLEYAAPSGRGLVNQGWKDSVDAVRDAEGRIATGPIALCEVQGYAYAAAVRGAALLNRLEAGSGDAAHEWASALRTAFQTGFCRDGFPVFALDGGKRQVDATTSNIGHLLGTGILDAEQERAVADRLLEPDMVSGLGLRTMSSRDGGYNPLSYHCGSVWAHDTGIVIDAMLRAGLGDHAAGLAGELVAAADAFDDRLPELWSGDPEPGVPYPAACRPQAWAAAAVVPAIRALREAGTPP